MDSKESTSSDSKKKKNVNNLLKSKVKKVKIKKGAVSVKSLQNKITKEKQTRKKYSSEALERGILAVKHGVNLRKAASECGVPASTLCRKVNCPNKSERRSGPPTVLSENIEHNIVNWMIHRSKTGSPVNKNELLDSIQSYLNFERKETPFKDNRPGRSWFDHFMKRYPNVTVRKAQNLTAARAAVTEEDLREWFEEIRLYLEENALLNLPPSNIFNCDETSMELCPATTRVFAEKGSKTVYNIIDGSGKECYTALFMFGADGRRAPPMLMFKGKTKISKNILQHTPSDWGLGISENGWMTADSFHEYFTMVFYPWLTKEDTKFPILVYMDGHASHISIPLLSFCREKQIHLILLFPNSTHLIQPLDIAYFHPLKNLWREMVPIWKRTSNASEVTKENFPAVLKLTVDSYKDEAKTVISGFKRAGLVPFNPDAVNYNILDKRKESVQN
ncbi:MFS-type transporter clz9-like [Leptopilina heterotoma]|uniref:MFS-type transporter clz9-like n=1 Tax=Leptopilina heterotoma TaxID=63436 RepID=UPI001CA9005A|nr:MFS-type transporter clz9-like [Leptopilina heterotoma]